MNGRDDRISRVVDGDVARSSGVDASAKIDSKRVICHCGDCVGHVAQIGGRSGGWIQLDDVSNDKATRQDGAAG